jgi:hypothetical protein
MWGVRCSLDSGVALALGLTTSELETRLRTVTLAKIAAERGVPMPELRRLAWAIAEPQLTAAVAAGAIDEGERTALHRRIDEARGPWSDSTSSRTRVGHHRSSLFSLSSSSSSRPAHVLGGSEAGKVSSSSSSSRSSSSLGSGRSSVTRASRMRS